MMIFTKIAQEAMKRGHEVYFCIRESDQNIGNTTGIHYNVVKNWFAENEYFKLQQHLSTLDVLHNIVEEQEWFMKDYEHCLDSNCVDFFKKAPIDIFFFDPAYLVNFLLLQELKVPSIALNPAGIIDPVFSYMYGTSNILSVLPQGNTGFKGTQLDYFERIVNVVTYYIDRAFLLHILSMVDAIGQSRGLLSIYHPQSGFGQQILMLPSSIGFDYPRQLATNVKFIGPILAEPPKALPLEYEAFLQDSKVILFSLGTLVIVPEDIMKIIIDGIVRVVEEATQLGFAKGQLKMIASINAAQQLYASVQNLSHIPQIKLVEWFPQNDLLGHPNTLMLIGHGGTNGISECIFHAKPILGIPFVSDQEDNMLKADLSGIGITLSKYSLTTDVIFESVRRILSTEATSFKSNIQYISNICRMDGGAKAAVHWIEYTHLVGSKHLLTHLLPNSGVNAIAYYNIDVLVTFFLLALLLVYIPYRIMRALCSCCCGGSRESNTNHNVNKNNTKEAQLKKDSKGNKPKKD